MPLPLLVVLIVLLLGLSLGAIVSVLVGVIAASVLLLLVWLLEKKLDLPMRFGSWPLATLVPVIWLAYGGWYVQQTYFSKPKVEEKPFMRSWKPLQEPLEAIPSVNKVRLVLEKEQLVYTLTVRYQKGIQPKIPKITMHRTFNSTFTMPVDKPPKIKKYVTKKGITVQTWKLTLDPAFKGPLDTPKFKITYRHKGKLHTKVVPRVAIEVVEAKQKKTKSALALAPQKGPVSIDAPPVQIPWPWIGTLGGTLVLAIGGLLFLVRRQQRDETPIPPHEWVKREYKSLQRRDFIRKGQFKQHYFALSELLRGYFERRYVFSALESTTEEILEWLKAESVVPQDLYREIRSLLHWMDEIKFAGYLPEEEEHPKVATRFETILERTLPTEEESEDEKNESSASTNTPKKSR